MASLDSDSISISMAAELLDMHPQTLRKYERLGPGAAARTLGSMRCLHAPRNSIACG